VSGNAWPNPALVTISFVPDKTVLDSNYTASNLFAKFNAKWSTATWQDAILTAAQTWAAQANINFDVVSDNGTTSGQGNYQQGDPGMGDIRIGGYGFVSNAVLAGTYYPPSANNYSIAGDMNFNTNETFNTNGSNYDLQTVALHEFGHALGLGHSTYSTAAMWGYYTTKKQTLSSDDIAGIQAIYGTRPADAYNTNSATANTSFATAASLTSLLDPVALTAVVDNLDITSTSQAEYFTVTVPSGSNALTWTVQSAGLSMFTPAVTVYAADQATVLGSASSAVVYHGVTESVSITGLTPGQQLYLKVAGVDNSAFSTGTFGMTLNFGTGASPSVTLPNTQLANGTPLTGGGAIALAAQDMLAISDAYADLCPCPNHHGGGCGCPACRAAVSPDQVIARTLQEQPPSIPDSNDTHTRSITDTQNEGWLQARDASFADSSWLRDFLAESSWNGNWMDP
jgi:predicted Zn-dependent protease